GGGTRIAGAGVVALIGRGAHDRIPARADARSAGVGEGAGAPVVAGDAVRLFRVRASAGCRIAGTGVVTLVGHRADDERAAAADAGLAGVREGADAAVVARSAARSSGARAGARRRVAGPRVVTLIGGGADDGRRADAHAGMAGVRLRAGVAVVADRAVRLRGT